MPGYGVMEAAETKEKADSWPGCCEHGGATKCWFLYLYYCGLWICLYYVWVFYICACVCGSTAWICIVALHAAMQQGIDL